MESPPQWIFIIDSCELLSRILVVHDCHVFVWEDCRCSDWPLLSLHVLDNVGVGGSEGTGQEESVERV